MARRLRIQFKGAVYHVINRGNYRKDVFETADKAKAFERALFETCERMGWILHAYTLMRNHYHLAVETPEPNLVEGVHWLQSTYATRFNRFRKERGHVFQGRYQSLLVEPQTALLRLVNYIHLNPVRAGIVTAEQVAKFRWSSLRWYTREDCPTFLKADEWLLSAGLGSDEEGWRTYHKALGEIGSSSIEAHKDLATEMCSGWAIGTDSWKKGVAEEHAHHALYPGISMEEIRDLKAAQWRDALSKQMEGLRKTEADVRKDPKGAAWKVEVAYRLRQNTTATNRWIAQKLRMGSPSSVSQYISRIKPRFQLLEA